MNKPKDFRQIGCAECASGAGLGFDFTMAFQPIADAGTRSIFGHEALVRGPGNEGADKVFGHVDESNLYRFDQACRVKAIKLAVQLSVEGVLCINFLPLAVFRPELCIRTTLEAADTYGFPINRIVFEVSESEKLHDVGHLRTIIQYYRHRGFLTAIDDFGAGYSGLRLLTEFQPDFVKLDTSLTRGIDTDRIKRAIVRGIMLACDDLSIRVVGECIETYGEFNALKDLGVQLFQGYYFARPAFEALAPVPDALFDAPG